MTQEDRELLLKDLCGRLPYGVKGVITYDKSNTTFTVEGIDNNVLHNFVTLKILNPISVQCQV